MAKQTIRPDYADEWDAPATPPMTGFDIVCTIGHVDFDSDAHGPSPYIAAFILIAEHGSDGDFSFPSEDGGTVHVCVDHTK